MGIWCNIDVFIPSSWIVCMIQCVICFKEGMPVSAWQQFDSHWSCGWVELSSYCTCECLLEELSETRRPLIERRSLARPNDFLFNRCSAFPLEIQPAFLSFSVTQIRNEFIFSLSACIRVAVCTASACLCVGECGAFMYMLIMDNTTGEGQAPVLSLFLSCSLSLKCKICKTSRSLFIWLLTGMVVFSFLTSNSLCVETDSLKRMQKNVKKKNMKKTIMRSLVMKVLEKGRLNVNKKH